MYNNLSQEKYGPLMQMIYNPELRWALSKMYENHLTFNSRLNTKLWMFNKRFCYIEMIKFDQSLWKVYRISTGMLLVILLLLKIDLY